MLQVIKTRPVDSSDDGASDDSEICQSKLRSLLISNALADKSDEAEMFFSARAHTSSFGVSVLQSNQDKVHSKGVRQSERSEKSTATTPLWAGPVAEGKESSNAQRSSNTAQTRDKPKTHDQNKRERQQSEENNSSASEQDRDSFHESHEKRKKKPRYKKRNHHPSPPPVEHQRHAFEPPRVKEKDKVGILQ